MHNILHFLKIRKQYIEDADDAEDEAIVEAVPTEEPKDGDIELRDTHV
jgi:hypothetical protein